MGTGRRELKARRERYFALVVGGMSSAAACRAVGVSKRTGKVWRNGRKRSSGRNELPHLPYVSMEIGNTAKAEERDNYVRRAGVRYLSLEDRLVVADLVRRGESVRSIGRQVGFAASTISRELGRCPGGAYNPFLAHQLFVKGLGRVRQRKLASNPELRAYVQEKLLLRWSPEQISKRLVKDFPYTESMRISHEAIYQSIYVQGKGQLKRELMSVLRSGKVRRAPQKRSNERRPRYRDPMVNISERPAEAEDRAVPGHWEGDLIMGTRNATAIGTLVERTSRFVMLLYLPDNHEATTVRDAIVREMGQLPELLRKSLTWDQGVELALHKKISKELDMGVFFCDPHSPWQRGTNENTNGLLRQFFPKGTNLAVHTPEELERVAVLLNGRPRKTLGWLTPAERLQEILQEDEQKCTVLSE